MKERPMLFNTDMVNAVLDGRKTQTRRTLKSIEVLNRVKVNTFNRNIFNKLFHVSIVVIVSASVKINAL